MTDKAKMTERAEWRRGHLLAFTEAQRAEILMWRQKVPGEGRLSFTECAERAQKEFGIKVAPWEISHYCDRYKVLQQVLRAVAVSSPEVLSPGQDKLLDKSLRQRIKLGLDQILHEEETDQKTAHFFAALSSTLASFGRNDLAREALELDKEKHKLQKASLALSTREQARKDKALKLEREKFEEAKTVKRNLMNIAERGGMTPELLAEMERELKLL